ncbi:uncharacterized protein LOC117644933 isoform X2 [Thrips palmi]|nr:uncharacterized protein LOC117644933 isoform X2 [Thrips palmi]XP_034240600.1 uncharacterized protein LOC117644933 isoform X2 [Thrips palmi]XP_034240601.1 uncharacterized protein LOC117644933 isoform X2 [Thrips palmi]XP_034240602.1 uncharacterized protein LOC117644933 isoform X2 [Thrips palmi]XP_034240603.1 uncharacterized protein LOC117644933 isoform X2 [Thrips palmi]XP_034240604.1 uncharacterized protein LOC117644933 isoform X2 [Thrips palmi]XP_034240606.1 uncharacterized protein LOC11764
MEESMLLSLSEDVLLTVLAYLRPEELLRCRLVCRRLRELCLHRVLWRKVKLTDWDRNLLHAAFGVAPCISSLQCGGNSSIATLGYFVVGTACVVTKLMLIVESVSEAASATAVICKLTALGGLRKLDLRIRYDPRECPMVMMTLMKAAYCIEGLQELHFANSVLKPLPALTGDLDVRPSLTRLTYHARDADSFLLLLLKTHAATLQAVQLDILTDVPVSSLAKLNELRSLECYPSEDLSQLASLPKLESFAPSWTAGNLIPAGALDFLSQAPHLRTLLLYPPCTNPEALLRSLVGSRSAQFLVQLDVCASADLWDLCVAPALSNFHSLQSLDMGCEPSDVFLRAVSPTSVPCLTSLLVAFSKGSCLHAWFHRPAIQDVLVRNPRLHLRRSIYYYTSENRYSGYSSYCGGEDGSCMWCHWGCHGSLMKVSWNKVAASAHARRAACPRDCVQVARSACPSCDLSSPAI